jgi:hypothetical protein
MFPEDCILLHISCAVPSSMLSWVTFEIHEIKYWLKWETEWQSWKNWGYVKYEDACSHKSSYELRRNGLLLLYTRIVIEWIVSYISVWLAWLHSFYYTEHLRYHCPVYRGTWYHSLLRYYATNWKVMGSNPKEVIGFFSWLNPSSHTMAQG